MIIKTEWRVEGQNPDGDWHMVGQVLGLEGDHAAYRDSVIRQLREMEITRYSHVRLAKYVTTIEVIGEDIKV